MKRAVLTKLAIAVVSCAVILAGTALRAAPASAADAARWNAGLIISDSKFYNASSMSAADIQNFLNSKGSSCTAGTAPCLKNYSASTITWAADAYCNGYTASVGESAATIIWKIGQSCGINPQVLLVTLEKENSLVTRTQPTTGAYQTAMGYGCPDGAACNAQYYGFFNQVYRAARQFKIYAAMPTVFGFRAGAYNNVPFNPNSSCGSSSVYIQNQATASLYNYTPYQPNQAALNKLYGVGDSCSSYGNRNFWTLFTDWFGDPTAGAGTPLGYFDSTTGGVGTVTVVGWAYDPDKPTTPINIDVYIGGPAGVGEGHRLGLANQSRPDVATAYPIAGPNHGFDGAVPTSLSGTQDVYVYAVNLAGTSGTNLLLGKKTATITPLVPTLPMLKFTLSADMTGDGRGELLAVDTDGRLLMFAGTKTGQLSYPVVIGVGFDGLQVFGPGDVNGDGRADVLTIDSAGDLWLYPGNGWNHLSKGVKVGNGWTGWQLVATGDLTGDGKADLLGIDANGDLFMYSGKGDGTFAMKKQVGNGWTGWHLYAAGDLNGDKKMDILGVDPEGNLYQYTGKGDGTFNKKIQAGNGWLGYTLAAGADLNGDGLADIVGRDDTSKALYFYRGMGNAKFGMKAQIAAGW